MSPSLIKDVDFILSGADSHSWFFWIACERFIQELTWIGRKCFIWIYASELLLIDYFLLDIAE